MKSAARPFSGIFTKDRYFYKTIVHLMSTIILQNIIAYSINMADNIMLGAYSQAALSGAATVNQVQFIVQQITIAIGDSVVVIGAQYWGKKNAAPVRTLTIFALFFGIALGASVFIWTSAAPRSVLSIFTNNESYIAEGTKYLRLIRFTYPVFIVTTILLAALRAVETVTLAMKISALSLVIDVGINYVFIFGKFGFPELGITGAAIGTLTARITELLIVVIYMLTRENKLKLFSRGGKLEKKLFSDYVKVLWPSFVSNMLWSIATPIQTSVLGHLADDAIAANSVSTTVYQYLKIVAVGEASASAVLIGKTVGASGNDDTKVKEYTKTLQAIYIIFGLFLGVAVFFLRIPFLKLYELTPNAFSIADGMLIVLSFAMVGMSYQMPVSVGIIKGGGDVKFIMYMNLVSTWFIVMPLTFLGAFAWNLHPVAVVAILNSDQIFKCLPVAVRCNRYKWIKHLANEKEPDILPSKT